MQATMPTCVHVPIHLGQCLAKKHTKRSVGETMIVTNNKQDTGTKNK